MNVSCPLYFNQVNRHVVLMSSSQPNVALFVTCLVDLFRPSVGFATVKLIEEAGCKVSVPNSQTCCGQPTYNSGDRKNTVQIARQVIQTFEHYDYVVAPSGRRPPAEESGRRSTRLARRCVAVRGWHSPEQWRETEGSPPEARSPLPSSPQKGETPDSPQPPR